MPPEPSFRSTTLPRLVIRAYSVGGWVRDPPEAQRFRIEGKVFIEGDDDGEIALRPLEDCVVRGALSSHVIEVPHLPMRLPLSHELAHRRGMF